MPQAPFPDSGPDDTDTEPDTEPDSDAPGPEQGLFITLPAEELTLSGFAQNGQADTMAPGALLATIVDTVTGEDGSGLAGCSDDQLLGIISGARRQECRNAWILLTAIKEFARRAGTGLEGEFAADELASELHMSQASAAGQMEYSTTVAKRLPKTFAAMRAGLIHPIHLRIIEEQTRILSDADAAKADQILAAAAPGMTYGELRYAARKLVLTLDPEAVRKQKEAAKRDTHVRRFREESGHGGMVARELPSNELLASWQHIEQRALDLRAAGLDGTLEELRVRAFLDLLQGRDTRPQPAPDPDPPAPATTDPATTDPAVPDPANAGPEQPPPDSDRGCLSTNAGAVALHQQRGYRPVRWFHSMIRDLARPIPAAVLPDGIAVTGYRPDLAEDARLIRNESFRDHWGSTDTSPQTWAHFLASGAFRPGLSFLACQGSEPLGMLMSREYQAYQQRTGRRDVHIALVGTRAAGRKQGIATALLVTAMSAARAAGYDQASLGVDADSLTGAVRLYERAGFAVDHTWTAYRKQLT